MKELNFSSWKYLGETQELVNLIDSDINKIEKGLTRFGGLIRSAALEREYCHGVGQIEALERVKKTILDMKDEGDSNERQSYTND